LSRLGLLGSLLLASTLAGCSPSGPPPLSPEERSFVDLYVRISVLDAWRADEPDSAALALDALAASHDSATVQRALARLQLEPERWEVVWQTIAAELHALEKHGTPRIALRALDAGRTPERGADSLTSGSRATRP
jgi:hypothetical protein